MKTLKSQSIVLAIALGLVIPASTLRAESETLLNESFASGNYNPGDHSLSWTDTSTGSGRGSVWTWSNLSGSISPNNTETYGANAMGVRGMQSLGANGGFEVMSDPSASNGIWQVATSVKIPTSFTTLQSANISFEYGFRGSLGLPSSFNLYDATLGKNLYTTSLSSSTLGSWSLDTITLGTVALNGVKGGDSIQLQWTTKSSSSALSLEVGGPVTFSVTGTTAPGAPAPPITACLAFAGVLLLQARRMRRNS